MSRNGATARQVEAGTRGVGNPRPAVDSLIGDGGRPAQRLPKMAGSHRNQCRHRFADGKGQCGFACLPGELYCQIHV